MQAGNITFLSHGTDDFQLVYQQTALEAYLQNKNNLTQTSMVTYASCNMVAEVIGPPH